MITVSNYKCTTELEAAVVDNLCAHHDIICKNKATGADCPIRVLARELSKTKRISCPDFIRENPEPVMHIVSNASQLRASRAL